MRTVCQWPDRARHKGIIEYSLTRHGSTTPPARPPRQLIAVSRVSAAVSTARYGTGSLPPPNVICNYSGDPLTDEKDRQQSREVITSVLHDTTQTLTSTDVYQRPAYTRPLYTSLQ